MSAAGQAAAARLVPADPARRVWLDGVGEAERPVDLGRELTGFAQLGLRLYRFRAGQVVRGESETDELLMLVLGGRVELALSSGQSWSITARRSAWDGPPHAAYLPPRHGYSLSVLDDADVAYVRAPAEGKLPPRLISPGDQPVESREYGGLVRQVLTADNAERLSCVETLIPAGRVAPDPDRAAGARERIDHYRFRPSGGRGLRRVRDVAGELEVADWDSVLLSAAGQTGFSTLGADAAVLSVWVEPRP